MIRAWQGRHSAPLLGRVLLKGPGAHELKHLAVLLKHGRVLSCGHKVRSNQRIYGRARVLELRRVPASVIANFCILDAVSQVRDPYDNSYHLESQRLCILSSLKSTPAGACQQEYGQDKTL